jgi:eukaryotic-like serine/threonine-protein kinase
VEQNFSHYRIIKKLGAGGMGEVYLAQDEILDRPVALKILPEEMARSPERMRRFIQEAKAVSALKHANVASIYELGEENGIHFIAMEHVEGGTLDSRISKGPLPLREILNIAIQVADALDEAHSRHIIHRDIKPSNIMITDRGQVKVLDFGLAKVVQESQAFEISQLATEEGTSPGLILGTVPFMSPEQALGKTVDHRSDIFSFGVVLYAMTTARLPFSGQTASELITHILQNQPDAIARFNYNAPPQLENIIRKCLEKEPERRYQSTKELLIDLTNLKRDVESRSATSSVQVSRRMINRKIIATVSLLVVGLIAIGFYLSHTVKNSEPIDSIAVLPFENTSHDPNIDYLSDGITENIIYRISQISSLKVMARSTVFRYKEKQIDPQKVGRELKVRAVMTGTVKKLGDSLVVGAELMRVADGSELWGQQYNRKVADLLPLQQEISQEISDKLRVKLTGEDKRVLKKQETRDPEAFQLYLLGRYYWNKRTGEGIRKAIQCFQQAITRDPNYAIAYVGLADSYIVSPLIGFSPPGEVLLKAKAAALKALEIDETNAEAHTSLGEVLLYEWNFPESEKQFRRAISLNPNYPTAHQWYAELLNSTGRGQESIAELKRALSLDPLSLIINAELGIFYVRVGGQTTTGIEQLKKTLELDPNFVRAHYMLAQSYVDQHNFSEAIREMEIYTSKADYGKEYLGDLACIYALSGRKAEAYKIIEQVKDLRRIRYIPAVQLASAYAGLGENDKAFQWLDEAKRNQDFQLIFVQNNVFLRSLHSDPRFKNFVHQIRLK